MLRQTCVQNIFYKNIIGNKHLSSIYEYNIVRNNCTYLFLLAAVYIIWIYIYTIYCLGIYVSNSCIFMKKVLKNRTSTRSKRHSCYNARQSTATDTQGLFFFFIRGVTLYFILAYVFF